MKIDEAAFAKAMATPCGAGHGMFRKMLENYLAALPSAEPGRDRIAVVVGQERRGAMLIESGGELTEAEWQWMEREVGGAPFTRAIIRCNLPRPAEPVEVEGSVEIKNEPNGDEVRG